MASALLLMGMTNVTEEDKGIQPSKPYVVEAVDYSVLPMEDIVLPASTIEIVEEKKESISSTFYVVNTPLNKRQTPNVQHDPIGYLSKGEPVEGIETLNSGWVKLIDGAFVNGKYLTIKEGMTHDGFIARQEEFKVKQAAELKALEEAKKQAALKKVEAAKKEPVASNKTTNRNISLSNSDKDLLARLVRAEAGGESYEGMVAVAAVVFNRMKSGKFPSTVEGVVYAKNQFSPVSNGSIKKPASDVHHKAVADALTRDNTNGALYFYAPSLVKSRYMESLNTVAVIGTHHFKK